MREPSLRTAAAAPRWRDSTVWPRTTSTRTGGGAASRPSPISAARARRLLAAGTGCLALGGDNALAILLAEDGWPGRGPTRRGAGAGRGAPRRVRLRSLLRRRRRTRRRLAGHRHRALPVGALLDDEHLGLHGALNATGCPDLEAATAVHVTFVIAVDDHV